MDIHQPRSFSSHSAWCFEMREGAECFGCLGLPDNCELCSHRQQSALNKNNPWRVDAGFLFALPKFFLSLLSCFGLQLFKSECFTLVAVCLAFSFFENSSIKTQALWRGEIFEAVRVGRSEAYRRTDLVRYFFMLFPLTGTCLPLFPSPFCCIVVVINSIACKFLPFATWTVAQCLKHV